MIKSLILRGANIDVRNIEGETSLFGASRRNSYEIARLLLENGVDVNTRSKNGVTPLFEACHNIFGDVAELLFEHGADANVHDVMGRTPLLEAAGANEKRTTVSQADAAIRANSPTRYHDWCNIMQIIDVRIGINFTVNLLIKKGADVNAADAMGKTPLMEAILRGNTSTSILLLELGAYVNLADQYGWISITYAAITGETSVLQWVLQKGAAVDAVDRNGCTPLYHAAQRGNEYIVKVLISAGANINHRNNAGATPYMIAYEYRHFPIAKPLLDNGAVHEEPLVTSTPSLGNINLPARSTGVCCEGTMNLKSLAGLESESSIDWRTLVVAALMPVRALAFNLQKLVEVAPAIQSAPVLPRRWTSCELLK